MIENTNTELKCLEWFLIASHSKTKKKEHRWLSSESQLWNRDGVSTQILLCKSVYSCVANACGSWKVKDKELNNSKLLRLDAEKPHSFFLFTSLFFSQLYGSHFSSI